MAKKNNEAASKVVDYIAQKKRSDLRGKRALWAAMAIGLVLSAIAFAYKVAEFIFTVNDPAASGFADVPVATYFFVAGGWLMLLVWCFKTGKFSNLEEAKHEMLKMEEYYESQGI